MLGLNPNSLGTVRALARAGVPVVTVSTAPNGRSDLHGWMSAHTRMARKVFVDRATYSQRLPELLLEVAAHLDGRPVLMPSGDAEVSILQEHRERLEGAYRIVLPPTALTSMLGDKGAFSAFAEARGVPSPRTLFNVSHEEVARIAGALRYPCIVKPPQRDALWDRRFDNRKALECSDATELLHAFSTARETHASLMVQEVVPGGDDQLVFSHVYIGRDGRELAMWTGHKVRQLPIHFGTSTAARTRWDDEVAALTRRLLADTGFVGYASVEFKVDARDGSRRAIEVTAGRTWYPHGLGPAAGVNLPLVWYRDAMGLAPDAPPPQREGVTWIDECRDVYAAAAYRAAGELTWRAWLASMRGPLAFAHFAWDDPAPGLFVILRLGMDALASIRDYFRSSR